MASLLVRDKHLGAPASVKRLYCSDQLPVQGPAVNDQYLLHPVSRKIQDTRQKPVWFQETSQHSYPPCESCKISVRCLRQQAVGLLFSSKKAYETTSKYGIIRDHHKIGLAGRLPVFMWVYLGDSRIRVRIRTTLWWILSRGRCINWWYPDCDMFCDWRLTNCLLVLPGISSEPYMLTTCQKASLGNRWTP